VGFHFLAEIIFGRSRAGPRIRLGPMCKDVEIVSVEQDGKDGVIVEFSDNTQGAYLVEELLGLQN